MYWIVEISSSHLGIVLRRHEALKTGRLNFVIGSIKTNKLSITLITKIKPEKQPSRRLLTSGDLGRV